MEVAPHLMTFHEFSDLFEFQQGEHLEPLLDLLVWASNKELQKARR